MDKKKKKIEQADVHEDLKGFDIKIDPFGNLQSNMSIEEIKSFLDDKVEDKKLKHLKSSEEE